MTPDPEMGWVLTGYWTEVTKMLSTTTPASVDAGLAQLQTQGVLHYQHPERPGHPQLDGLALTHGLEVGAGRRVAGGSEADPVVRVPFRVVPLPGMQENWRYNMFTELNMHNPDNQGFFKPDSVMMFGETFQCAAWLVLSPENAGVNVTYGTRGRDFAEQQFGFLRCVCDSPSRVTRTDGAWLGSTPVKLRLDQVSPLLAEKFREDARGCALKLRERFVRPAKYFRPGGGLPGLKDILGDGLPDDLPVGHAATVWNRITPTENNAHFDMTAPQLDMVLKILWELGVRTVFLAGEAFDARKGAVLESHKESGMRFVNIVDYHTRPSFQAIFPDDASGMRFSGQIYTQLLLAQSANVKLTVGPHSGATDYLGFVGLPVAFWTATNHPAHPRIPRLCHPCDWWHAVPVGSVQDFKDARSASNADPSSTTTGFTEVGKERFRRACEALLSQVPVIGDQGFL